MYELILWVLIIISLLIDIYYLLKFNKLSKELEKLKIENNNLFYENKALKQANMDLLPNNEKEYTIDDLYGMEEF